MTTLVAALDMKHRERCCGWHAPDRTNWGSILDREVASFATASAVPHFRVDNRRIQGATGSESTAECHPKDEDLLAVNEINVDLRRDFPLALTKPILAAKADERLAARMTILDPWRHVELPSARVISKRKRKHPAIEITKRMLSKRPDSEAGIQSIFVLDAKSRSTVMRTLFGEADKQSDRIFVIFVLTAVTGRMIVLVLCESW